MKIRPLEDELFHADGRTAVRQMNRHDEVSNHFLQLNERA